MNLAVSNNTTRQKNQPYHYQHKAITADNMRKFRPASRTERLTSWNQRLQLLFTRQTY